MKKPNKCHNKERKKPLFQYSLASLFIFVTLVAAITSIAVTNIFAGIVLSVLVLPSFIRVTVLSERRRTQKRPYTFKQKFDIFVCTALVSSLHAALIFIFGYIACVWGLWFLYCAGSVDDRNISWVVAVLAVIGASIPGCFSVRYFWHKLK